MNQRVTIHDVAERANVSISTVHQALNGKKGVGEDTRRRIQEIAEELGYQPNLMASSLKRKARQVAVVIPNSNYYKTVWNGIRDASTSLPNMNIKWIEMPFGEDGGQVEGRTEFRNRIDEESVDGILVTGHSDVFTQEDFDAFHAKGIAVSLIGADLPGSQRLFCVQPDYTIIGQTMAELVLSHIPSYGSIALCAGNPQWAPHTRVVEGFQDYLKKNNAPNRVYIDHSWSRRPDSYASVLSMITQPDVAACCSVLSQSSVLLGQALVESGKANRVFAVGSDLSEENIAYLKEGVFNNLIQKNPYAMGYLSARNLADYLLMGRQPEPDLVMVGSEVIFHSNVSMYQDQNYRTLLR